MSISPITLLSTVLGGLLLAALLGWVRKPRLVVFVPRLLTYSQLTDRGQLAEVTIFNRGFKTEEMVEISLNPNLRYEVVGSNSQDTYCNKNKISVSRVGPSDEVTVLLLVEGGVFTKDDILSCLSKESKGTIVAKLEQVPPTGQQRIGIIAFLIGLPVAIYGSYLAMDYVTRNVKVTEVTDIDLQGWKVSTNYKSVGGELYNDFAGGKIKVSLGQISRNRDIITVPVVVENKTSYPFRYTVNMTTKASEGRIPSYRRYVTDVLVVPGDTSQRKIDVVVPIQTANVAEKYVYVDVFLESMSGDSLKMLRTVTTQ